MRWCEYEHCWCDFAGFNAKCVLNACVKKDGEQNEHD